MTQFDLLRDALAIDKRSLEVVAGRLRPAGPWRPMSAFVPWRTERGYTYRVRSIGPDSTGPESDQVLAYCETVEQCVSILRRLAAMRELMARERGVAL